VFPPFPFYSAYATDFSVFLAALHRNRGGKFFIQNRHSIWQGDCVSELQVQEVGTVRHYFSKIGVAVIELSKALSLGDQILVKGPLTNFEMTVDSMQVEHESIQRSEAGRSIGLKLAQPARERDVVYKKS
jgi:hypothetical protein